MLTRRFLEYHVGLIHKSSTGRSEENTKPLIARREEGNVLEMEMPITYHWKDKETFEKLFFTRSQSPEGRERAFELGIDNVPEFVRQVSESLPEFLEVGTEFTLKVLSPEPRLHKVFVYRVLQERKGFNTQTALGNEIGAFIVDLRSPS